MRRPRPFGHWRLLALLPSVALAVATPDISAQWSFGADVAAHSSYEWRGVLRHDGWVLQPDVFVSYGSPWWVTAGALATIAPGDPEEPDEPGEPDATGFGTPLSEINVWIEAGVAVGGVELAGGWTRYEFDLDDARGLALGLVDTQELYVRARLYDLPLITPQLYFAYDIDAIQTGYVETSVAVRIPGWAQVEVPVGSLIVTPRAGWSFGVELPAVSLQGSTPQAGVALEDNGLAHWGLGVRLPIGPFAWGPLEGSVSLGWEIDWKEDPATRRADATGFRRTRSSWFVLSFSLLGPLCQPGPQFCPNR